MNSNNKAIEHVRFLIERERRKRDHYTSVLLAECREAVVLMPTFESAGQALHYQHQAMKDGHTSALVTVEVQEVLAISDY